MGKVVMTVNAENLNSLLQGAWEDALELSQDIDLCERSEGWINRQRSKEWMNSLGKRFQSRYDSNNDRVFWRGNPDNERDFHLQEMLFDLAVCKTSTVDSYTKKAELPFITGAHWLIESEFEQGNSREIVIDMSKLVMGSSENKLFVASHKLTDPKWESGILEMCSNIAKHCAGNKHCAGKLFFCFIAHPKDWHNESAPAPSVHQWTDDGWKRL